MDEDTKKLKSGLDAITSQTKITIGAVVASLAVLIAYISSETSFKVNKNRDILELKKQIASSEQHLSREIQTLHAELKDSYLKKMTMQYWILKFQRENPDVQIPEINNFFK